MTTNTPTICASCERITGATKPHCELPGCPWWNCPTCGADNDGRGHHNPGKVRR